MVPLEKLRSEIITSLSSHVSKGEIVLEKPPKEIQSDLAFPCFSLAKKLKKSPVEIASDLAGKMKPGGLVREVEAKGPYLNFHADWPALGNLLLKEIKTKKGSYGSQKRKEKVLVEFAHPNTHKAFHIGHVRNIALGESLSRLLEHAGFKVARVNYQGDIGPHVAKNLWGLLNLRIKPPSKDRGKWLGEVYAKANKKINGSENLEKEVREINKKLYAGDKEIRKLWKQTRQWSLDYFESVYRDFGAKFDRFYFESEVEGPGIVLAKTFLKKGVAKKSEGAIVMDLEKEGLGIYVLLTQDQTPLYSIKDFVLAGFQEKEFHPSKIIHVVGTEQILHFRQLFKGLERTNPKIAKKEMHLPYELVNLKSGKMSSREGNIITYDELKEEVFSHALKATKKHSDTKDPKKIAEMITLGGIKYDILKQSPEKVIVFDWEQALSFDGNAAPYLQYTHARACSILKKARSSGGDAKHLTDRRELELMKHLLVFPEAVESAARDYRPHYLCNYVFELATFFNDFYQNIPVLKAESGVREARLALVKASKGVLGIGLNLLGIEAPERM